MMSSSAANRGTWEQDCVGLCELCYNKAADVECASCGPVRVNSTDSGPLLQCGECSADLHSKGVFVHHALVKISRKLWLPVEDKLGLLKQQESMLNDRKAEISEAIKKINDNYHEAVELLEVTMKELQGAIVDKKQMLINSLTEVKDQQLLNFEHINVTCSALMDHVTKIISKTNDCLALEARQFAEQKMALLDEMSTVLEQSFPPLLSVPDLTFSMAESVAKVKRQIDHLLILPLLEKRVRAGEQIQGMVVNKLTPQGLFWLRIVRRDNDGALMVISQSIRADLQHDRLKPVTKATVGQLCCACFSEDKQWHRARVVTIVSSTHVKICYVDFGNYEECPVTHLRSLPEKYLFYPFQTIKCCLTNDDGVECSREARWLFNDRTKNKIVNLHIISELPSSSTDNNDICYLATVKEPGEGGADISNQVLSKMKEDQSKPKHPIIHRDYRLTQQHKLAAAATPTPSEAPPNRPPSRLNTDAAEFVSDKQSSSLQQPGVLQVSQTVFHNMVGVSVTSNVVKIRSDVTSTVKNNKTVIPKEKEGHVTTSAPITDAVTTSPLESVTTTTAGVVDSVTTIAVNKVTATSTRMGCNDVDTTTVTSADNVTTAPIAVMEDVNTTPVTVENNVTTTPTENVSPSEEKIDSSTVPENCVTNNVTITPNGVGDIVTTDAQVTTSETGDDVFTSEVKNDVNSEVTTSSAVEDKGNDKEGNDATELVDVHNLTNNDLPCSSDANGCHDNHNCSDSKDDGHDLEHFSADNVTALSPSTKDVRSHDAEVGVAGVFMIDNVAPPPNEALVAGATIEISVVSDLQSDGTFWSQLVADEETDEIFCDLMESLQSICTDLHSNQKCPRGIPLVGSFCAALFSADKIWYRALVEQVTGDKLLVRYMDYGNAEMVSRDNIVRLVPKMKELPFQAFLSTMASEEHNNFTPLMCERFSSLVKTNDVFQAKVVSVKGGVVEVELTVELNNEVINVNDDVYLTDFVTTDSLHFSQAALTATDTDTKLTWTEQMEALDSPVTPTKQFPFQLSTSDPDQPLARERSKSREKSKSHKSSPVCSVRKISSSSSRRMLRRQSSSEKPSGNKKQEKKTTISNEDSGIVPSSENWENEESLVGGVDGCKDDDDQMLFIKGLPPTINIEATKELFSKYGNVKNVKLDRGRAWITMDVKGAKNAALQLRNHVMSGGDSRGLLINERDNYHYKSRYRGQGLYKRY